MLDTDLHNLLNGVSPKSTKAYRSNDNSYQLSHKTITKEDHTADHGKMYKTPFRSNQSFDHASAYTGKNRKLHLLPSISQKNYVTSTRKATINNEAFHHEISY